MGDEAAGRLEEEGDERNCRCAAAAEEEEEERLRFPMLALFFMIDPSVSLTPNSLTPPPPRDGHVRELWPLLVQWEQRRVMPIRRRLTRSREQMELKLWIEEKRKERKVHVVCVCNTTQGAAASSRLNLEF